MSLEEALGIDLLIKPYDLAKFKSSLSLATQLALTFINSSGVEFISASSS